MPFIIPCIPLFHLYSPFTSLPCLSSLPFPSPHSLSPLLTLFLLSSLSFSSPHSLSPPLTPFLLSSYSLKHVTYRSSFPFFPSLITLFPSSKPFSSLPYSLTYAPFLILSPLTSFLPFPYSFLPLRSPLLPLTPYLPPIYSFTHLLACVELPPDLFFLYPSLPLCPHPSIRDGCSLVNARGCYS